MLGQENIIHLTRFYCSLFIKMVQEVYWFQKTIKIDYHPLLLLSGEVKSLLELKGNAYYITQLYCNFDIYIEGHI